MTLHDALTVAARRLAPILLWCALAALFTAPEAAAQHRFDSWSTDDGLPHKTVHAALQTREGYIWLATTDGLVRFDGVRFVVFDAAASPGFVSNRTCALFEDARGDLWIGTEDSGVMRFRDGRFASFTTADGLPHNDVIGIAATDAGDVVVQTEGGTARLDGERFVPYVDQSAFPPFGVALDGRGGLWYAAGRTARRVDPAGTAAHPLAGDSVVVAAFRDSGGAYWIGTKEHGIGPAQRGVYRIASGGQTLYTLRDGMPATAVTSFCEDREGAIWMGTLESGLVRLHEGRVTRYTTADGLSSDRITSVLEDREGNIWVATRDNGLNRARRRVVSTLSSANGLAADNTYPIFESRSGAVWIGGWGGLTRFEHGRFTHYRDEDGLVGLHMSIFEDREGALWIGSFAALTRFRDGRFELMSSGDARSKIAMPDPAVLAIHQDREGAMWFGTVNGLVRYRDGASTVFTVADGLPENFVQAVHEARDGTLWVGTRNGLARSDAGGRFVAYTEVGGRPAGRVRCFYEDADGVLWIGTYDGGLLRMKEGRFTRITTADGLFDDGAFQILEDARGFLWMSCNRGIYSADRRELNDVAEGRARTVTSRSFDTKDGMLDEECNGGMQPAGCRTRDGRLWFPTQQGVAIVDPEAIPRNPLPPPVLIEEVLVERRPAALGGTVEIAPDAGDFEIHYTGLSFVKSERVTFRYQMVGLDRDWVDAGTRRTVYYNHLPPGDYLFRVTAANADGVWNAEGAEVRVRILPPFYRTWWFLTLATAIGCAAALTAYRRRVSRLQRARAAQEAFSRRLIETQEQERQRIAAELHDGLGQNLLIIKNRALLGRMGAGGAAGEQFDEICESASRAIDEVREIAHDLRPHHLDRLGLTKTLEAMVERAGAASGVRFTCRIADLDGALSKPSEIHLFRIAQECVNNILRHAEATEAEVAIARDERGARVRIRDDGRGFPAEADSTRRGFGLAGIRERVRMLGGTLSVQSTPGQGTTVTIQLPLHDETP